MAGDNVNFSGKSHSKILGGTGVGIIPRGTTAERPVLDVDDPIKSSAFQGGLRWNVDNLKIEYFDSDLWQNIASEFYVDTEIDNLKQYVDDLFNQLLLRIEALEDTRVLRAGDTMTGFLILSGDPVQPMHAATKKYVDDYKDEAEDLFVNVSGDMMTGFLTLFQDPVNPLHAATKQYVDAAIAGLQTQINNVVTSLNNYVLKAGDTMSGDLLFTSYGGILAPAGATGSRPSISSARPGDGMGRMGYGYIRYNMTNQRFEGAQFRTDEVSVENHWTNLVTEYDVPRSAVIKQTIYNYLQEFLVPLVGNVRTIMNLSNSKYGRQPSTALPSWVTLPSVAGAEYTDTVTGIGISYNAFIVEAGDSPAQRKMGFVGSDTLWSSASDNATYPKSSWYSYPSGTTTFYNDIRDSTNDGAGNINVIGIAPVYKIFNVPGNVQGIPRPVGKFLIDSSTKTIVDDDLQDATTPITWAGSAVRLIFDFAVLGLSDPSTRANYDFESLVSIYGWGIGSPNMTVGFNPVSVLMSNNITPVVIAPYTYSEPDWGKFRLDVYNTAYDVINAQSNGCNIHVNVKKKRNIV